MPAPIDFYFDFSSPYGYLASEQIDALAARHGRGVAWRPILLGVVFQQTGSQPLLNIPLKGGYARHDLARSARLLGLPFQLPATFPFLSVAACRAYYWLHDQDPAQAVVLAKALYREAFGRGGDIDSGESVLRIAQAAGTDRDGEMAAALNDPAVKQRLRDEVSRAISKGVFGSPLCVVDGEPFWGHDRLEQVDLWLQRGGW
ncbi:MAG: 2-hydroxychromene-2-carboxylate isomerase [Kiloniellaceae bacterium]|jgi:2-hydroxychromene-2-carboxylate isomerase|nr:2-hydroxychromene-2-carboxylate isomerase [Kiloniellaceae bacterium]